jgi:hypothetical protein
LTSQIDPIDTFEDPGSELAFPQSRAIIGRSSPGSIAFATTFSPRFTIVSPQFHQPIFRFRRLPFAKDLRR